MTKAIGHHKEAFNIKEVLEYFRASNYEDCRINAYPSFTNYPGYQFMAGFILKMSFKIKAYNDNTIKCQFNYMSDGL
jgi:hypothetical protein